MVPRRVPPPPQDDPAAPIEPAPALPSGLVLEVPSGFYPAELCSLMIALCPPNSAHFQKKSPVIAASPAKRVFWPGRQRYAQGLRGPGRIGTPATRRGPPFRPSFPLRERHANTPQNSLLGRKRSVRLPQKIGKALPKCLPPSASSPILTSQILRIRAAPRTGRSASEQPAPEQALNLPWTCALRSPALFIAPFEMALHECLTS